MTRPRRLTIIAVTVTGIIALLVVLDKLPKPANTFFWRSLYDGGHAPLFGVMALLMLWLSIVVIKRWRDRRPHYLLAFVIPTAIGMGVELAQIGTPRDADPLDALTNMMGAAAFLLFVATLDPGWKNKSAQVLKRFKDHFRFIAGLAIAIPLVPALLWAIAIADRNNQIPLICGFETYWETKFMQPAHSTIERVPKNNIWPTAPGDYIGKIYFDTTVWSYPTVGVQEPYPDWQKFSFMHFSMYSLEDTVIPLYVRINDRLHNESYMDRYNAEFELRPGENKYTISLQDVRKAPVRRLMNMSAIRDIKFFTAPPAKGFYAYIDDIRLE